MATGIHKAWRKRAAFSLNASRKGHERTEGWRGTGKRATSEATWDGEAVVLADYSTEGRAVRRPGRWGSETQATHCREGEAGHNVLSERKMRDTQKSPIMSANLRQIAAQAKNDPTKVFISLAHLMDEAFLREAYRRVRKDGAPGLSGVTSDERVLLYGTVCR